MKDESNMLRQAVSRALSGIKMVLGRGRVQLVQANDAGPVQVLQVIISAKETMDIPRLAEFGFASRPPKDSDCVTIFLNGERTWGVVIATGHQKYRFQLENDGEAAIHDAFGKSVWFRKDNGIVVEANNQPITINHAKGLVANFSDDVTLNMGGKNLTVSGAGTVTLGPGGKKVVVDGDPVIGGGGGTVQASQSVVKA